MKRVYASVQGAFDFLAQRHHHHRDIRHVVAALELFEDVPALPVGKVDIHYDQRGVQAARHRFGFQRQRRRVDVEAFATERAPDLVDHVRVIPR